MKFPTTCEEFLTTLKAKSKVEGRQPEKSKSESLDPFNYEEVLKVLGRFGTWQCLLFAQLAFVCLLDGLFENLYAFTAFTPKYRCSIPFCEHPQNASYFAGEEKAQEIGNFPIYVKRGISADLLETGESCEYLGISGMPMGMDQEAILSKESCDFYLSETGRNSSDLQQMKCGDENLIFDKSLTSTSIVTSFHLTCSHRKWIKSFVDVLHHVAFLFGLVVFGLVADRFGRQKAILGGLCFTSVAGIFAALADGVGGFAFFHFCVGLGKAGLFLPAFILMLELSGKTLAMCLFPAKIVGGGLCASLLSYLVPVWTSLQLVAFGLGLAFFIPVTFFAHESPRWLLSKGKCDTARNVVKQAALMNGREIKVHILHPTNSNKQQQTEQENKTTDINLWRDVIFNLEDKTASFYRWWMVNLCFQWTFLGLCLKGQLVQAAPPGNPYANVSYEALTSIPGLLVALFLSGKTWGSRPLLTFCHLLSGGMFLVQSFGLYFILPSLALFGHLTANMFLYGSLASLQLLTSLMAPATQHRATFCGICWAFFATGAVASHLLNLLVITAQWLPTAVLALFSIMAAFLVYFFPETTGLASIPENWEHIKVLKTLPKKSYLQFNLPQLNVLKSILNLH